MDETLNTAIDNLLKQIRTNIKPEDALKVTQAVLNLAHARIQLSGKK